MFLHLLGDMQANYSRFIKRVRSSGAVWGLQDVKGWATCPSNECDREVYTFWSDKAYAKRHCNGPWANFTPASIALDAFLNRTFRPKDLAARIATRRVLGPCSSIRTWRVLR
jgi:hypothetical protein